MRTRYALAGLLLAACYSTGEGIAPPLQKIYFPVGLAVSDDHRRMYIASSDFDLQFNAGSLQVIDLERVREIIPVECTSDADCRNGLKCDDGGTSASHFCVDDSGEPCGAFGDQSSGNRVLVPGRCAAVDLLNPQDGGSPILVDAVGIGAFATDIALTRGPDGQQRLLVPVRGESSLHYIDIADDGSLECGQDASHPECDQEHRVGTDPDQTSRGVRMPPEPFAIAASADGEAIAVTHQTGGEVSLFVQDLQHWEFGPRLEYVTSGLPTRALAIASVPDPAIVERERDASEANGSLLGSGTLDPWPPGFLVGYGNAAQLDLLRFFPDSSADPSRPYLQLSATVALTANVVGTDTRGIAFDDAERRRCETSCADHGDAELTDAHRQCLADCASLPVAVYATSRSPASLLVGATLPDTWQTPNRDVPRFYDTIPLPTGPSRVYVAPIISSQGQIEQRVFVVCFDSRRIAVYDPIRRRIERFITTGRGPHAMAFDWVAPDESGQGGYSLAYIAHFTDSYVGVVQLDARAARTYGEIVLSLAPATAPRASK